MIVKPSGGGACTPAGYRQGERGAGWWASPDLVLRYNKTLGDYNRITAIAWHELTHASHLQRMKSEKGYWWASDYWSTVVYREITNSAFKGGDPYGSKGDDSRKSGRRAFPYGGRRMPV
jgi:hypothetical protein